MLGSFFSAIGGSIGKYIGGGILSSIGRYAGKYIGDFLERKWFYKKEVFQKYASLKESFTLSTATLGSPIPLVFGKTRVFGKIIWVDEIKNAAKTSSTSRYFGQPKFFRLPKQVKSTTYYTEYEYFLSFAVAICQGEIREITKVWNGNEIIDISHYKFRLYKGAQDQMPDPYIQAKMNGCVSAFRDLAYIVFEDLPLADFEDVIPNLSFEVTRKANVPTTYTVEDMVKSMVMIPGSGEYVYDTVIQKKQIITQNGSVKCEKVINSHNIHNIANSIHSLNQLKNTCENIEWVAPVICWFGNSLDLSECLIRPAVEFKDPLIRFSEEWRVGEYTRENAHEIAKDINGNPRYGGSVNDQSVIRYLQELKSRGLKIMFYPMFFMDADQKPWRGHLTGAAGEVERFFRKRGGYNEFILHYANLVKDYVDAFIIGSELIGLTKIKDPGNNFPAVNELANLAGLVKTIVGQRVLVSYAADWSEYHHTEGGWYNLDPLWASQAIDFIGIDAYFPLTNIEGSFIADKDIKEGFSQGEGYDFYACYERNQKIPLAPAFAWKNLKYWWENTHRNPDGIITAWQPRSKKIWFTEYGFPSIDKASNQPNVFFDPLCKDGGIPKYSNGEIDFSIQRRCIRAFIEFWGKEEYIENMFLWTWDARPYPAWPHMDIWRDGYLWEKGHWVNDKFGMASVASIILEISNRCKIDLKNVEAYGVDEVLSGVIFNHQLSAKDAISILRSSYFFDINASDCQKISFIKRGQSLPAGIESGDLIKLAENTYVSEVIIAREQMLAKANIYFQNQLQDYEPGYLHVNNEQFSHLKNATLRLPFVITISEAAQIGKLLLKNAAAESKILEFNLPISYIDLEPADFISLEYKEVRYYLRVIKISFTGLMINVIAVVDDINSYHSITSFKNRIELFHKKNIETEFRVIELPFKLYGYDFPYLTVHLNNKIKLPLYVRTKQSLNPNWNKIALIEPTNSIARIVNFHVVDEANPFLIDDLSTIEVRGIELEKLNDNNWKLLEINNELIAFKNIKKIPFEEEIYSISHLIRGTYGTQGYIKKHEAGSVAAIFTHDVNILPISEDGVGQTLEFKIGSIAEEVNFTNCACHHSIPLTVSNYVEGSKLRLCWVTRNFNLDSWIRVVDRLKDFSIKLTAKSQVLNFTASPDANQIEIDISDVDISEGYKIDII